MADTSTSPSKPAGDSAGVNTKLDSKTHSDAAPDPPQHQKPQAEAKSNAERKKNNFLWVSNIERTVKAADLRALFMQVGKVTTAKILTNGKSFYGCVAMENHAVSLKCVKQFNNTELGGTRITVSKTRPDRAQKKEEPGPGEKKPDGDDLEKTVAALRKKVEELSHDNTRLKRKLDGYSKRYDITRDKCFDLERDIKKLREENREERRVLDQEKLSFERDRQQTIARIKADREEVAKNLGEVKKLKERLKAVVYKRERSPHKHRKRSRTEEEYQAVPKLDAETSRKRYSDVEPHFEYRHRQAESGWSGSYPRVKSGDGYPPGGRFGAGVTQAPSSVVVSTRGSQQSYYHPW